MIDPELPGLTIGGAYPAQDCDCLHAAALPICAGGIRILTELPNTDITVYVQDSRWKNTWPVAVTTDAEGYALLELDTLPSGLFNSSAGWFKLWATLDGQPLTEWINLLVNDTPYLCVFLSFTTFGQEYGIITL